MASALPRYYPGGPPPIHRATAQFDLLEMLRWMVSILPACDQAFHRAVALLDALLKAGLTVAQRQEIDRRAAEAVAWWQEDEAMHRDQERAGWRFVLTQEFLAGRLQPEGEA